MKNPADLFLEAKAIGHRNYPGRQGGCGLHDRDLQALAKANGCTAAMLEPLVEAWWQGFHQRGEELIDDQKRIRKAGRAMAADCAAHEKELQARQAPPAPEAEPAAADPDLLFEQRGGGTAGTTHWMVTRVTDPGVAPGLVRFRKTTAKATQLDQIAQWLPLEDRWAPGRWKPVGGPKLPKWLVELVEARLRQEAPPPAEAPQAEPAPAPLAMAPKQLALL